VLEVELTRALEAWRAAPDEPERTLELIGTLAPIGTPTLLTTAVEAWAEVLAHRALRARIPVTQ
jgi:hypothetical protein